MLVVLAGSAQAQPAEDADTPTSSGQDASEPEDLLLQDGLTDPNVYLLGEGYPEEERPAGVVGDAEEDLDQSFPQRDSVFSGLQIPRSWGVWQTKRDIYDKIGLKLGASYQMLFQYASETAPSANFDTALGHWWGFTSKWTMINRGEDYEGSLVVTAHERVSVGDNAVPAQFGAGDVGASWSNYEFTEWDISVEDLYWEQWLKQDVFTMRIGNQIPTTIYNPFRFKDARTSFTASPFAFHESIPYPTYGLGMAFKWWPLHGSELYFVGTLNDMNGDPNVRGLDWGTFGRGEYFYGFEAGYYWRRANGEFDHLHLDVFYADERSTRNPDTFPNEAGGGVKLLGSKQIDRVVGFGSYTYNTAEGGGISVTFGRHTATAGAAYLNLLGIRGETALGLMWMQTHPDLGGNNQYGLDAYWRILLTPNLWITPGIQVVVDPAFNPGADVVAIPSIKYRLFL